MLLVIDCGNTNIVFALYDKDMQVACWRISSDCRRCSDEYVVWLTQLMTLKNIDVQDVEGVVIASVVPDIQPKLVALAQRAFNQEPLCVGDPAVDLGISVNIDRPEQAGADRLVNAVAAAAHHQLPVVIIDFGTATTLDLIGPHGSYEGGVIAPGVNLSVEALYMAAARLPRIAVKPWRADMPVLGTDTLSAMHSGVFWGYVGMVEGLLGRLRQAHGAALPAIATGGLAQLFAEHIDDALIVDVDLTLKGLVRLYALNKS
ncbi:type III pantothenate kinase [Alphaproteobacteria bacterium]|nr:type III pantothenate kinase [Alphaproteobacteria bacterium]